MAKIAPRTDFQATQWGFTTRDFGIIAVGLLVAIAQVITPYASIFVRLVFFVLIILGAVTFAFWRVDQILTIEEYLAKKIKQWGGVRDAFTKDGADFLAMNHYQDYVPPEPIKHSPTAQGKTLFMLPQRLTPNSNEELVVSLFAVLSVVAFTIWAGNGGIEDAQIWLNNLMEVW